MAEVTIEIGGGHEIVSAITRESAERLGFTQGMEVRAIIKATEVLVAKD
jgi:molybdate transport system regulatory protein